MIAMARSAGRIQRPPPTTARARYATTATDATSPTNVRCTVRLRRGPSLCICHVHPNSLHPSGRLLQIGHGIRSEPQKRGPAPSRHRTPVAAWISHGGAIVPVRLQRRDVGRALSGCHLHMVQSIGPPPFRGPITLAQVSEASGAGQPRDARNPAISAERAPPRHVRGGLPSGSVTVTEPAMWSRYRMATA